MKKEDNKSKLVNKALAFYFGFIRTQYRIAYEVRSNLIIVAVETRENFYRDLVD